MAISESILEVSRQPARWEQHYRGAAVLRLLTRVGDARSLEMVVVDSITCMPDRIVTFERGGELLDLLAA